MDCARFGKGDRALVILPGLSVQRVDVAAVSKAYAAFAEAFTVYLLEPHKKLSADCGITELAADAAAVIRTLGLESVCLFGVSMGGMIAQTLTIRNPGLVEKLILGSTFPRETETLSQNLRAWKTLARNGDAEGLYLAFGELVYAEETFAQYRQAMIDAAKTVTAEELARFAVLADGMRGFDVTGSLDGIRCPVLFLGAKDDRVLGEDAAARFAALLGDKTDAQSCIYTGYGHAAYDFAPDYKERMLRFLAPRPGSAENPDVPREPEPGGAKKEIADPHPPGLTCDDRGNGALTNSDRTRPIRMRPHHGMCFQYYEGKGYSAEFTDHMGRVLKRLSEEPERPIRLTTGADAVCVKCPNDRSGVCADSEKVDRYDAAVLRLCGLRVGDTLPYREFVALVKRRILNAGLRGGICGDCCWNGLCQSRDGSNPDDIT